MAALSQFALAVCPFSASMPFGSLQHLRVPNHASISGRESLAYFPLQVSSCIQITRYQLPQLVLMAERKQIAPILSVERRFPFRPGLVVLPNPGALAGQPRRPPPPRARPGFPRHRPPCAVHGSVLRAPIADRAEGRSRDPAVAKRRPCGGAEANLTVDGAGGLQAGSHSQSSD